MCRVCVVSQSLTLCGGAGWLVASGAGISRGTPFTSLWYDRYCGERGGTFNKATAPFFHTWGKHSVALQALYRCCASLHSGEQSDLTFKWTFSPAFLPQRNCSTLNDIFAHDILVSYLYLAMIASLTTAIFSDLTGYTLSLCVHFKPSIDMRRRRCRDGSLAFSAWVTVQVTWLHRVHLTWDPFFRSTIYYIHLGDISCSTTFLWRRCGQSVRSVKKKAMICFRFNQTQHMVDLIGFTWTRYKTQIVLTC